MNSFALLSLYRSLTRQKLYTALNIGGLAVGIAVFLVLGLYVRFETSFERWVPDHAKLYLVEEYWDRPGSPSNGASDTTMGGLIDQIREDFPGTVATRMRWMGANVIRDGVGTAEGFAYADINFLDLFRLPMVAGDGRAALRDPTNVLLSETMARKYFPDGHAIGRPLIMNVGGTTSVYRVAGIFRDLPKASVMDFTLLGRMPADPKDQYWYHWGSERVQTFLRFDTPAAAEDFTRRLPGFVKRRGAKDLGDALAIFRLQLLPITDWHLQTPGRKLTMVTLGLVGVLTLLIAIINYVNLATARSGLRAREVAMRKVLGANRGALIRQFLGEAILTVAIAALVGGMLAEVGLPFVNAAGGLALTIPYAVVVPTLALLVLLVGLLAGIYPALLLSRYSAAAVLASAKSPGGGRAGTRLREGLVVLQFALATAFIIGTAVLIAQTRHVRNADPGFRRDGLILVMSTAEPALDNSQRTAFLERVRAVPGVHAVSGSEAVPGLSNGNSAPFAVPGRSGEGPSLQWFYVGPQFFDVSGIRLLVGRVFDDRHRMDDFSSGDWKRPTNVVINRRAAEALGFPTPEAALGRTFGGADGPRTVIGVVENARFFGPRDPVNPTLYYYTPRPLSWRTVLRVDGDPVTTMNAVRTVWRQVAPAVPFEAKTVGQNLERYYEADDRATRLFGIGAGLAVLIGCVGLWGLASFNTARRVREIGIRKTLGASSTDIVRLLVGQFLRPVLVANLIAWPLAFLAMQTWLAGFDDRIALSPLYFVGASLIALVIAGATVSGQALRASRATPAWALRHD
ncbi:ABC transporter permease [Sphingomonas sanguinis]|uniref:ABC transporter permease n=1 Tax=Sphingomonas sp. LC-1 TaxID=3110957 RepID=UPI0021BB0DA1|nr:ABC transporter permease [Sphingomonas sp. LC-1]MCT8003404.1 ABC transporter permease [Sphingomonas sp. LC-1]